MEKAGAFYFAFPPPESYEHTYAKIRCQSTRAPRQYSAWRHTASLARHPRLRVAFLEANCSWLPWLLWRLDEGWEREGDIWAPDVKVAPSEYFKRQCAVSAEPDEATVTHVIEYTGGKNVVFSTDYPHGDSKYPKAVDHFLNLPISETNKKNILWDNCAAYYAM